MSKVIPIDCHSLLTIHRSDLDMTMASDNDDLALFQLPDTMNLSDLPGSRLVAATPTSQACWINENKGVSYAVSRVETSNSYIMVKPNPERPSKKLKRTMNMMQVQLLQRGGSGASFLELKEHPLDIGAMHALLKQHIFHPFDPSCNWKGLSVDELVGTLQVSQKQVMSGLTDLRSLALKNRYGLLSEEGLMEAQASIVSTLTEVERFNELVDIDLEDCVRQAVMRTEEQYDCLSDVIRYTLSLLQSDCDATSGSISLDLTKVAQCVVHRLFRQQGIWETDKLLTELQRNLPGVHHQVGVHMLHGIAIPLPNEKVIYGVEMTVLERLEHLFAIKDGWSRAELVSQVGGDEWTKHCKLVTRQDGEKLYHLKKGED